MAVEVFRIPMYELPPVREQDNSLLVIPSETGFKLYNWRQSLPSLNRHLESVGVNALEYGKNAFCLSDLNLEHIKFDPLRVDLNPLGEDYTTLDQAAGSFGLQVLFWREVHNGLTGLSCRPSRAIEFRLTPVFRFQGRDYLRIFQSGKKPKVYGINYLGDGDAVSRAGREAFKAGKNEEVRGCDMGLDEHFFHEYLRLRREIDTIEMASQREAVKQYVDSEELKRLKFYLPFSDQIKTAIASARRIGTVGIFSVVMEVLEKVEEKPDPNSLFFAKRMAEPITDYITVGFDFIYDNCLKEAGYIETIGELRGLMNAYYEQVIRATE